MPYSALNVSHPPNGETQDGGTLLRFSPSKPPAEVSTTLIAGVIKVALLSSAFGVMILGFAALLWFALQFRWRVLQADEVEREI